MKKISKVRKPVASLPEPKKVAAYCRVSSNADRPQHSLATQINYFTKRIESNPDWELVGIYSDFGISGTGTAKRAQFQKMIEDCKDGKIEMILTKSIQRFARNTIDLLDTVRSLKAMGIEVYFEKENISTFSGDGEFMLSILASIAQEESISTSQNINWSITKQYEMGRPHAGVPFLGYRWNGEKYEIQEDEARTVHYIFDEILAGKTRKQIADSLNKKGWLGINKVAWSAETVGKTAKNIHYTGVLLLGQNYRTDPISHKLIKNNGNRPMYLVENAHEAIISKEQFDAVQEELSRRNSLGPRWNKTKYPFSGMLYCKHCGQVFTRGRTGAHAFWDCSTAVRLRRASCPDSEYLDEESLFNTSAEVLGLEVFNEDIFKECVEKIEVQNRDHLFFHMKDGSIKEAKLNSIYRKSYSARRKQRASALLSDKRNVKRSSRESVFTRTIKCGCCGDNYSSYLRKYKDDTTERIWSCRKHDGISLKNSKLQEISQSVLNQSSFDEDEFDRQVEAIHVDGNSLRFELSNGVTIMKDYHKEVKRPCRK